MCFAHELVSHLAAIVLEIEIQSIADLVAVYETKQFLMCGLVWFAMKNLRRHPVKLCKRHFADDDWLAQTTFDVRLSFVSSSQMERGFCKQAIFAFFRRRGRIWRRRFARFWLMLTSLPVLMRMGMYGA